MLYGTLVNKSTILSLVDLSNPFLPFPSYLSHGRKVMKPPLKSQTPSLIITQESVSFGDHISAFQQNLHSLMKEGLEILEK